MCPVKIYKKILKYKCIYMNDKTKYDGHTRIKDWSKIKKSGEKEFKTPRKKRLKAETNWETNLKDWLKDLSIIK